MSNDLLQEMKTQADLAYAISISQPWLNALVQMNKKVYSNTLCWSQMQTYQTTLADYNQLDQ